MKSIKRFIFVMAAFVALLSSCSTDAGDPNRPSDEARCNVVKQLTIGATSDKITLSWVNPSAPYYGVKISMDPAEGDLAEPKTYKTEKTDAMISGLRAQTKYTFTFTSIDAEGKDTSQSVSIATTTSASSSENPPDEARCNVVKQLTIGATSDKVTLSWANPSAPYYGVKISMDPAEGGLANPKTYKPEETNAVISGLRDQTKYTFTFTSIDAEEKDTSQSVSITMTTSASSSENPPVEDSIPPKDVTGLNVTNTASSISVKWKDATDSDIFGYIAVCTEKSNGVERALLPSLEKGSVFVLPGEQKCEFTDINDGKTYTVTVKAMDTSGNVSKGVSTNVTTLSEDIEPIPFGSRTENLDFIFGTDRVAEIVLTIDRSEWNTMLDYYDLNSRNEECVHADFEMTKGEYKWKIEDVGIRPRGNTSRVRPQWDDDNYSQAHFKIDFEEWLSDDDPERKLAGCMKGLILKRFKDDPTYSREVFGYNFFRDNGIWTSPRAGYAHLVINITEEDGKATKIDYGVYAMIEEIKKQFLKERSDSAGGEFKNNKGNLWKCCWQNSNEGPSMTNRYNIYGSFGVEDISLFESNSRRYDYDLKTNKDDLKSARAEFINFINDLNKSRTEAETKMWFESKMDVSLFLKTYACNVLLGMDDDYWCNHNNYYFYFDKSGKAYFIPYDYDNILGINIFSDTAVRNPLDWGEGKDSPLIDRLLSVPEFMEQYKTYLLELSSDESDFVTKSQDNIRKWQDMIKEHLAGSDIDCDKRAGVSYNAIEDYIPNWCSNGGKYKLLSGDETTNYFKAKAKSVQAYCNSPYITLTFKFDGPDGNEAVFLDRFGMPCQNPYKVEDAIVGTQVSKYIAFETCQAAFVGWFNAEEDGDEIVIVPEADTILYARWRSFPYTYKSDGTTECLTLTFNPDDFTNVSVNDSTTVVAACVLNSWGEDSPAMERQVDGTYRYTYSSTSNEISSMWPGYKFVVGGEWIGYDRYKYQMPEKYAERSGDYNFLIPEFN